MSQKYHYPLCRHALHLVFMSLVTGKPVPTDPALPSDGNWGVNFDTQVPLSADQAMAQLKRHLEHLATEKLTVVYLRGKLLGAKAFSFNEENIETNELAQSVLLGYAPEEWVTEKLLSDVGMTLMEVKSYIADAAMQINGNRGKAEKMRQYLIKQLERQHPHENFKGLAFA